jgi:FixJ family two-component response regulator
MLGEIGAICVLDDDQSVLCSLRQLLDSDGFEAQTFESAETFLAHVEGHAVELAVLDVRMPVTNGLEVQERLHVLSPKTKVIVVTAREEPAIRAAALGGGALAFLIKPFDDEAFLSIVRSAICHPE